MKESHRKALTRHPDPESCGAAREGGTEALTGAGVGEVLSHEISSPGLPTLLSEAEGNNALTDKVRTVRTGVVEDPQHALKLDDRNWEILTPRRERRERRAVKVTQPKTAMDGDGKSEQAVVSKKQPNDPPDLWASGEEVTEKRACAKRNSNQHDTCRTQSRKHRVNHGLERVRQRAKQDRKAKFTSLLHHLSIARLRDSFERLKPQAAAGVDGICWADYRKELEANIHDLHGRVHRGSYHAKPARRAYIPKADGRQRPLGIAALEDKVVQGAMTDVFNAIYEVDFLGFSYGFRPGRSPHDALDALAVGLRRKKVNWLLDADIKGFFDTIEHSWMDAFLRHRIGDRRVLRLIHKWLKAGVMEAGKWQPNEDGTPQGATISPLLANVYLHYAFDLWAHLWRQRHAQGEVIIVRFADDFVVGFQHRRDAERFHYALKKRLEKFALHLHGGKTRLMEFGRFAAARRAKDGEGKPLTFDFLGFTHICSTTRDGKFRVRRRTVAKRKRAKLQAITEEMCQRRHERVADQGRWLHRVISGYYRYHGVHGNLRVLCSMRYELAHRWYRSLRRRSQKKRLTWQRMNPLVNRWLPYPRLTHPWPEDRFSHATTQGRSPVR